MLGRDIREECFAPVAQRFDPVIANVEVVAIELGRSGDTETVLAQTAGHDLGLVIQQADPWGRRLAGFVIEVDGDRISFDRVDVHAVAQFGRDGPAADTCANHDTVKMLLFLAILAGPIQTDARAGVMDFGDLRFVMECHAEFFAAFAEFAGIAVNVTGEIGWGVEAANRFGFQSRFQLLDFGCGQFLPLKSAFVQHDVDAARVIEFGLLFVDMQNAAFLDVEFDPYFCCKLKQVFAGRDGELCGFDCVGFVIGNVAHEFGHP